MTTAEGKLTALINELCPCDDLRCMVPPGKPPIHHHSCSTHNRPEAEAFAQRVLDVARKNPELLAVGTW